MLMIHFIMYRFYMEVNTAFVICFIIAILATKSNSFMQRLHMFEKVAFPYSLMVTMLATISNSFMQSSHMLEKAAFLCSLIVTMLTSISNSFMQRLHMSEKVTFCLSLWSQCSQLKATPSCTDYKCWINEFKIHCSFPASRAGVIKEFLI